MATTTAVTDFKVEATKVKWDPKSVEIRTRSVEKTLEPLVHQVNDKWPRPFYFENKLVM